MTAISAFRPYASGAAAVGTTHPGVSVDAQRICHMLGNVAVHWIGSATGQTRFGEPLLALIQLYQRCQAGDWDGEGGEAISIETLVEGQKLLSLLPLSLPTPDFLPEATGAIAFEWYRGRDRVYVLSVSGAKTIEFAGLFGHGNELHGKVNFEDSLPSIIREHLREFFRQ